MIGINLGKVIIIQYHFLFLSYPYFNFLSTVYELVQLSTSTMASKLELDWTQDNRSIGICEDDSNYRPLIMFNFKFLGYISSESNPYRGYQVLIQTAGGNDFTITITERELQSFPLFVFAVKSKTHGEVIQHASFDNSLWTEMAPKIILEYP